MGTGARGPFQAGANEVAGGGAILDLAGAGFAVGATESAGGRGADIGAGSQRGSIVRRDRGGASGWGH